MIKDIKSSLLVRKLLRKRWFWRIRNAVKDLVLSNPVNFPIMDDRNELDVAEQVLIPWPSDCAKPRVGLVRDRREYPYWTKFERFLKNNDIPFDYYEVHRSNWLVAADQFDVILWAPEEATNYILEEGRQKSYILEKFCGKVCLPSFDTLMWNEDKLAQYELLKFNNFPVVETFISHDFSETLTKVPQLEYPLVAKTSTGAGSLGVELVKNSLQAGRISKTIFSGVGRTTYAPNFRQKNYVYFQKFQPNEGYDLRITVVGDIVIGYYRYVPKGDFRASGMNTWKYAALPEDAMQLGRKVSKKFNEIIMSIDMLRDPRDGKLYIIELSAMPTIWIDDLARVDGVKGIYIFNSSGKYIFQPCNYLAHELVLSEFFNKKWFSRFKDST
jgi:glutathione synthase/RimK-type ligase-like ATP-grasp enzyme